MAFLRGEADVLVSTSIIESGIDIPQANTLIVDRADLFGLSQLYQIRGRVGRSRERAYAYLLYPSAAALTPEAADRLSALSDYTELGAGFKVAMRDLELRGAGNLLGDEQSGHVAALGFELYMQMLDEAVREMDPEEEGAEHARAGASGHQRRRLRARRTTSRTSRRRSTCTAGSPARARPPSWSSCGSELEDRFGEIPEPLENLITLQQARIKLGRAGATTVSFKGGRLAVTPIELDAATARRLREILPGANYEAGRSQLSLRVPDDPLAALPRGGPRGRRAAIRPARCLKVESKDRLLPGDAPLPCAAGRRSIFACAGPLAPAPVRPRPLLSATNDQGCSHRNQPRRRHRRRGNLRRLWRSARQRRGHCRWRSHRQDGLQPLADRRGEVVGPGQRGCSGS